MTERGHGRDLGVAFALLPDEQGVLDRDWREPGWVAYRDAVVIDDDVVRVDWKRVGEARRVRFTRNLLERFVRLDGARVSEFRRYAARCGLLDMCTHGLWMDHGDAPMPWTLSNPHVTYSAGPCGQALLTGGEPLSIWRYWVRQARALLSVILRIREGKSVPWAEWEPLTELGPWTAEMLEKMGMDETLGGSWPPSDPGRPLQPEPLRGVISATLQAWLRACGVHLTVSWAATGVAFGFESPSLLGGLGLQLTLALSGREKWAVCTACGSPYAPMRLPKTGQRNYCPTCRAKGVPVRDAQRDKRAGLAKPRGAPEAG